MGNWRDDWQIERSDETKRIIKQLGLNGKDTLRIDGILGLTQNLGMYEDFLPHLKGKKGRKQLYESIMDDINQHIWHKDLGNEEPMPEGWRV